MICSFLLFSLQCSISLTKTLVRPPRTGCQFGVPGGTYPPKKYPRAPPPPGSTPHDMFPGQHCISLHFRDSFVGLQYYTENDLSPPQQGARKVIFKACHSGKLKLAYTSPNVISTSPKNISMSRIDFTVLL